MSNIPLLRNVIKRKTYMLGRCFKFGQSNHSLFVIAFLVLLLLFTIIYYETKLLRFYREHSTEVRTDLIVKQEDVTHLPRDLILIYNRVPKTGSTSFMGIAYDLCAHNGFHVMHLNTSKNSHVMSLADQLRLAWNVTEWHAKHPLLIHGHMAFLNFARFGLSPPRPLYINIIRRPLDRLVSYYYFLRNGDNFRPNLVRRKQGDKRTFDECVERNDRDCRVESLWLQIPFFCGQSSDCWKPGNRWALEQAKRNLVEHFFLVGVTEAMQEFIQVLEAALPQMFTGASAMFEKGTKAHLRKTFNKIEPSSKTIAKIQQSRIWQMENEFYQFVVNNFNFIKEKTLVNRQGHMIDRGQQFFFEKIRPR